ncbi:hypothetical protein JOE59_001966 [Agromyces cerinus]|uniref:glycosyl hydrolase family 95 catalytic domain-containing protein n=1 Tax=Agromyces cerinus TaxID=33878 RepID=UPI001956CA30|nr:discoidin domain-containing protein [Agromyces cerinus]MBM7831261.1 hypothetical protein [Agromyces cerinus]
MRNTRYRHRIGAATIAVSMSIGLTAVAVPAAATVDDGSGAAPGPASADWERISEIVGGITGKWTGDGYPGAYSDKVPNTALLGNGDLGVTSAGAAGQKSFLLSKSDFVSAGDLKGVFNSGDNLTKPLPIGGITIQEAADETARNLAPGYSAVTASSQHPDFAPKRAVTGTPAGEGWVSQVGKQQWLELSFAEPIDVQRWVVWNDGGVRPGQSKNNTSDFRLQVSETGGPNGVWTDVSVVDDNAADVFDQNLETSVRSAHFRLYITEPLQPSNTDSSPRARIGQLELYESAKAPGTAVTTTETQDILNAEVRTSMAIGGVPVDMETWLAPDANVLVTEVTSKGESAVDLDVKTWGKPGNAKYPVTSAEEHGVATATRSTFNNAPANPASWRSQATLATAVVGADAAATADSTKGEAYTTFTLEPGETVQIVTAVGGGGKTFAPDGSLNGEDPKAEALTLLAGAADAERLGDLEAERTEWWKDFWSASFIDLPNRPEVMRYYYGAQYLLGSTSRDGELAPGLYGIWHTTDNPSWSSDYHLNYNFIATFYGTDSSNRPELSLPAADAMLSFMPEGERRAADPAQLRRINSAYIDSRPDLQNGIADAVLYPVGIGPWGTVTDDHYLSEALNAAYSANPLIEYYRYTQDTEYLESEVYDYLVHCVNFYDAWLDKSGEAYTLYAGYNEGSWAKNPAVELAALKNVLGELIDASETLDRDAEKRAHWQDLFDRLAPQPTSTWNGKQVYSLAEKEWKNGQWVPLANPVPADGNIIPLDIVVPGGQLGFYSPSDELEIARNTIDVFGDGAWRQINNFPRIFNDAVQSRYPAGTVLEKLTRTINEQIQPNLRISDGVHGVEKIGATAAINNMLLMSDQGVVKVFPNWVAGEDASFARLRAEGAFVVSAGYDGAANRVGEVSVTSEAGQRLTIASPWAEGVDVFDSAGVEVETVHGTAPNWSSEVTFTFDTRKGETYTLRSHTPKFEVEVDNGEASPSAARAGETVTLTADAPADFHEFDRWITDEVTVADDGAATTTFVMPDHQVTAAATYRSTVPVLDSRVSYTDDYALITFPIRGANGKNYEVYVSKTGEPGSFTQYRDVRFNSKGARLYGLEDGTKVYAYVVYRTGGDVVEVTAPVVIEP